ncbi:methyl-accepting chemotaxis protein [Vogesella sp. LIG4]|uniref:methyl-accepting chemotaxis protein n=1 Tax=Vogesella sp. LIG4 TaxID=1192162 RepID=UPI00138FCA71|nr:methyl-accepting chemotaxis protein [Vogesella sp. LIG4]
MSLLSRFGLRFKLQAAFLLVSGLTIAIFTWQMVSNAHRDALRTVDAQLQMAARAYVLTLGDDYHDHLQPRQAVDLAQKHAEAVRLRQAAEYLGVKFLYGYIVRDGSVIYSQAAISAEQEKDPKFEMYLKPNDVPAQNPPVLEAARSGQAQFLESQSPEYGHLRSIMVPMKSRGGQPFVACADADADKVDQAVNQAMLAALATSVPLLLAAILASWLLSRVITRPLLRLLAMMQSLTTGSGDLTVSLQVDSQDEIGQIARHFNTFMAQLREMFLSVREETVSLIQGVQQIGEMTTQLSAAAREQSDVAAASAASVEQITVSIDQVAQNSRDAEQLTRQTGQLSEESARAVEQVSGEIGRTADFVGGLAGVMSELDEQSQKISLIVGVIRDIADQTNLLALNAAIEAARAGEQGRGFAVVADEVRKLAERTGNATVEIGRMIDSMRQQSTQAMGRMNDTHQVVQGSVDLAGVTSGRIGEIRSQMELVVQRIQDIALSANEQSHATAEMARSAERISVMAQQGEASISGAKRVVDDLNSLANTLHGLIARFRL